MVRTVKGMKIAVLVCLFSFILPSFSMAQDFVPGEVIVKLKSDPNSDSTYKFMGKARMSKSMKMTRAWSKMKMYKFKIKEGQAVNDAVIDLMKENEVEYAEPNYILRKSGNEVNGKLSHGEVVSMSGNGPIYSTEASIGLEQVIPSTQPSSFKPIIAVIDTGLDISHPIITGSDALWVNDGEIPNNGLDDDGNGYVDDVNGWNFVADSGAMFDDDDHGTHVAGTILSVGLDIFSDTIGESSVKIMPLKFLDDHGVGTTSDAIDAINYALDNGAHILNNSWGGEGYSTALHEAVVATYNRGTVFVAAAGNLGSNNDHTPIYPASYDVPNLVSVGATTNTDSLASFSNFGYNSVDVGSPGVYVLSSVSGGNFAYMSGTSMASPIVSGIAALMLKSSPEMLGHQIKGLVEQSSDPSSSLRGILATEARVNAFTSIALASSASVDHDSPSYSIQSGRDPAASAGGCGIVTKLTHDAMKGPKGPSNPSGGLWFKLITAVLLLGPVAFSILMRKKSPEDQRRHERFSIDSDVRIKVGGKELVGSISTISLGGVQLNTEALLEQGGVVRMSISSPDGKEALQVAGAVVWNKENKAYGVKFADPPTTALNRISDWTNLLKKSTG